MTWEFRPGVRDKTSVITALAGSTGSGKTYSAILMGVGLAYPHMTNEDILATIAKEGRNRIVFIDTEGGRGLHYSPGPGAAPNFKSTFPYDYADLTAPYSPDRYREVIDAANNAGYDVIIIDSMSHEHESEGGICEMADEFEAGILKPGKRIEDTYGNDGWKAWAVKPMKSPGNWKEPKRLHKKMVGKLLQQRAHIICCLRAEEKMKLRKVGNKIEVVPAEEMTLKERWVPICEKRFMFEMTVSFLLTAERPGVGIPIKNLQDEFAEIFHEGTRLSRAHGEALSDWARGQSVIKAQEDAHRQQVLGRNQPDSSAPAASDGQRRQTPEEWVARFEVEVSETIDRADLALCQASAKKALDKLAEQHPTLHEQALAAIATRLAELSDAEQGAEP